MALVQDSGGCNVSLFVNIFHALCLPSEQLLRKILTLLKQCYQLVGKLLLMGLYISYCYFCEQLNPVACSLRWLDYQNVDAAVEESHIRKTVEIHQQICGQRPLGFYQGKPSLQTRSLVSAEGGFLYDSDAYNDDLPYWTHTSNISDQHPHLIIPYTLKFVSPNGFVTGSDFELYLRNHLDYLLNEAREDGEEGLGFMMSVGLHCRIVGRAGRCCGLEKFIDYALSLGSEVWICRREEIAKHWYKNHWDESWGAQSKELLETLNKIR
jgi:hypothetical protein